MYRAGRYKMPVVTVEADIPRHLGKDGQGWVMFAFYGCQSLGTNLPRFQVGWLVGVVGR